MTSPLIVHAQKPDMENPFLVLSLQTPFQVPPFDKIKPEHFLPAFEQGIMEQNAQITDISQELSLPLFENTVALLEKSGELLKNVTSVFFNLSSANTSPEIEQIAQHIAPVLSRHVDDIYLNSHLFQKIKAVYHQPHPSDLTLEQTKLLENTYKDFVRSGANLDEHQQAKMRSINQELSILTVQFGQNLLAETNNFELIIEDETDLAGLPASLISAAAHSGTESGRDGKWKFTLHSPSVMPFLEFAENRTLRERMYLAYVNRCNNNDELDNKEILVKIASLRAERAGLLGYASHAHYVLEESMAKTPANACDLLDKIWKESLPVAKQEALEMQKLMNDEAEGDQLAAWDWLYYADRVRKARYGYDGEDLKPYFKLENVRDGIFKIVQNLYGLTFAQLPDMPVYHPDVAAFEVKDADGSHIGILYMDFFTRQSKRGGAWMTSYRRQSTKNGKRISPVISIVCNYSKPAGALPLLLNPDEVETFFHEFGHALHGLLSNVEFESLAGTSVSRDFVELPSQIMEHWAFEPEVLALYAKHHTTGTVIPEELVRKMKQASKFNQGFATVEYLAASMLDMAYHTLRPAEVIEATSFEKEKMKEIGLIKQIAPRYRSTYFQHIFSGGYAAAYYSYIWSEVLDSDAFAAFKEKDNLFDPAVARSFRTNILEKGGTAEPMALYKAFRGREPLVHYLLQNRGLAKVSEVAS